MSCDEKKATLWWDPDGQVQSANRLVAWKRPQDHRMIWDAPRHCWRQVGILFRLRPTHRNHVWSYDFVMDATDDGRPYRMLNVIDEFTRECLTIKVARKLSQEDVQEVLTDLFCSRGVPEYIRSDNGSEVTAKKLRAWLERLQTKPVYIEPGSPWENGYVESLMGNCAMNC